MYSPFQTLSNIATCLIWRDVPRLGAEDLRGPGRRAAVLHRHAGAQRERGAQAGAGGADHAGGQVSTANTTMYAH